VFKVTYSIINDSLREDFTDLLSLLPDSERESILQLKSNHAQLQKTVARVILLNQLTAIGYPSDILAKIDTNSHGKPFLPGNIRFNISHSHDLVAVCISDECNVGIDVEKIRAINLAGFEMYFSSDEWKEIQDSENSDIALLKKWTAQEAFLKARGTGFSNGTTGFQINYANKYVKDEKTGIDFFFDYIDLNSDYIVAFCSGEKKPLITVEQFICP
jgi:phosphopantetheinyl transferase